jgi:hypothetical protein
MHSSRAPEDRGTLALHRGTPRMARILPICAT